MEFREQFGQAVMLCLKMLSKTVVDRKSNFSVFLSLESTPKPELVTLVPTEHSWTGLLKDTANECSMAAFGDQCLRFKHGIGATCGGKGKSAFLTAILFNGMASFPTTKAHQPMSAQKEIIWDWSWDVKNLQTGNYFWLGERGTLRLKSSLENGTLVTEWSPSAVRNVMKLFTGKDYPHREYTEIDQSGEKSPRPIPVIVVSDRGKERGKEEKPFIVTIR